MRSEDLSYFEEPEFQEALHQYESALLEGRPFYMEADDLTDIAEYYMINERAEDAQRCIDLAVQLHPDATDPQVFLARQALFYDRFDEAKRIAWDIQDQEDREVQFLWAEIAIKEGKNEQATERLKDYYLSLSEDRDTFLYDTANVFIDYEQWDEAERWTLQLRQDFPQDGHINFLLSEIMTRSGRSEKAIPLLQDILTQAPFNKDAWNLLAEAQGAVDKMEDALDSIEFLLAIDEDYPRAKLTRAQCLFHLNRMEEAHQGYLEHLKQSPEDAYTYLMDSIALANMERYDEALTQARKALNCADIENPEFNHIYLEISYILSKQGDKKGALQALEAAYDLTMREIDAEYYLFKGRIYLENEDAEEAARHYAQAQRISKDPLITQFAYAVDYAENAYYEKASSLLHELLASDMNEKESTLYPYLAYCAYFLPERPHYQEYMEQALQYNPEMTKYLFSQIYPPVTFS